MPSVLITGANRGLGLELSRQYAADGWRVFACSRDPDRADALRAVADDHPGAVSLHPLDVTDHAGIDALARELRDQPLDVLLNNAGVYGPRKMVLGQLDYRAWERVLAVNVLAPVKMAEALFRQVAAGGRKVIAYLSSAMGSIAENTSGRHYLYRTSKAALNAAVKSLSIDLRPLGVIAVALHPAGCAPTWAARTPTWRPPTASAPSAPSSTD
jgi:NAD(P)-dependent dehydrogenase (short-subunit alcohol dehydrogenase family)